MSQLFSNRFTVNSDDEDSFFKAWADDAALMKQLLGFTSTQLHRGIADSTTLINYAVWESVEAYKNAVNKVDVQPRLSNYPASFSALDHGPRNLETKLLLTG